VRRLAAVDWLLIGTLLPICLASVVLSVVHGVRGDFRWVPLALSSAPDKQSHPIVRWVLPSWSAAGNAVAVGDRVLRLEGNDLRGLSVGGFVWRACATDQTARSRLFTVERVGVRYDVRVPLIPGWDGCLGCPWWGPLPLVLSLAGTALLVLVRAAHWHVARRLYVAFLLSAIAETPYFQLSVATAPALWFAVWQLFGPMIFGVTLWSAFEFTPGSRLSGFWQRALPWTPSLLASASAVAGLWLPDAGLGAVLIRSFGVAATGYVIALLVAVTRAYRRSDPLGRRQLKWVTYGFYVSALSYGLFIAVSNLGVLSEWVGALFVVQATAQVAIPLGFVVAIAFYQFLDIDSLFSATLSYSVLAFLGIAIVLGVMPTASRVASDALGLTPASGQILLSLGLAAVLVPAYRIVRPRIDRLLFPERASLEQGFERLLAEIPSSADTQELTRLVGERLDALLRPAAAVTYGRAGDVFTPIAVRGRPAPPAFAAQSALIAALQERTTPLAAAGWAARHATSLTLFERAAIETLDLAVLVPIWRGPDLVAFSCLGPKRSGDIYTTTDLALLGAVAGKVSDRLLALDATLVAEQAHQKEQPAPHPEPDAQDQQSPSVFQKEGDYWTVAYADRAVRLKDSRGLQYLAHLLRHAGQEILAIDLAADGGLRNADCGIEDTGQSAIRDAQSAIGALDARAKAAYQQRLEELRDELSEAEANNDIGRAERARAEMDMLAAQLRSALGLGGRDRPAGSDLERARSAVGKRIRAEIKRIRSAHPTLGLHLLATITTGYFCSYQPERDVVVKWEL
jgi:hypothetical protein